jgi:hypothetical protein
LNAVHLEVVDAGVQRVTGMGQEDRRVTRIVRATETAPYFFVQGSFSGSPFMFTVRAFEKVRAAPVGESAGWQLSVPPTRYPAALHLATNAWSRSM